jgi:hypothetical protein
MTENIGHRKWSKKMPSLGEPTFKKKYLVFISANAAQEKDS